jgi:NHLM bacteriocin system ABC transporter peptidase/ATP-binding protein
MIVKTPVVMQMEALECGAAALCMILAYYGKWLPLEKVRYDCDVSRDGSNAVNILKAARTYGLKATGARMEPADLRKENLPAIIHWNFNHFVVLNGFTKKSAVINDPAGGTIHVDLDTFDKSFTGIVLRFEKTAEFVKEGKPKSVWGFAAKKMKGAASAVAFVVLICAIASLLGMLPPMFSKVFMDNILLEQNNSWLLPLVAAMGLVVLFEFFVAAIRQLGWYRISGQFAIKANAEFMWHVLRLPMDFFAQRWAGDLVVRQDSNSQIISLLIQQTAPIAINIIFLIFYVVLMASYSVWLTVIVVVSVIINAAAAKYRLSKITNLSRKAQQNDGKLAGVTMAGIEMIETIKASGAENSYFGRFAGYFASRHNADMQITKFAIFFHALVDFLRQLTTIIILMAGASLILDGKLTIGILLAFLGFFNSFMVPVNELVETSENFAGLRVQIERVEDVLNYKTDTDGGGVVDTPMGKLRGEIEIRNVTFGYSRLNEPLIRNFSITVKPGESVALVGRSGSGKSTLAKLITGLYKPWEGEILFDGKKREEIDEPSFKSSVAMVDQEISIFEDTIAENIRIWDNSIEDFAIVMAARDADIHDTIVTRTDGYGHLVREGGKNFSGGEKQRLEIARVLAVEPTVIMLDEATSALDAKTEEKVTRSIKNIGATCIIIAHRLSAVRDCDQIIVLDNGLVAERGTHDELMALNSKYAELVTTR